MKVTRHKYLWGFLCLAATAASASELPWAEDFTPPPGKYSWIQLDTGEWLKGDIIAIYDDRMAFDSDHFDNLTLDLEDVEVIFGRGIFVVSAGPGNPMTGFLQVRGQNVLVNSGDRSYEFDRNDLFVAQMRHFLKVAAGITQPLCTLQDGIQALKIALAAYESQKIGKTVQL